VPTGVHIRLAGACTDRRKQQGESAAALPLMAWVYAVLVEGQG
jgi:hypothetical protein